MKESRLLKRLVKFSFLKINCVNLYDRTRNSGKGTQHLRQKIDYALFTSLEIYGTCISNRRFSYLTLFLDANKQNQILTSDTSGNISRDKLEERLLDTFDELLRFLLCFLSTYSVSKEFRFSSDSLDSRFSFICGDVGVLDGYERI